MTAPSEQAAATASDRYLALVADRIASRGSYLCLGVDPDPDALPPRFPPDARGIEAFAALVLETCSPWASAVKFNLAFFEAFGSAGLAALERLRTRVVAGLPVILDAKRADVRSTAVRQAVALYDALGADAVTVNPYLGFDALGAFLERGDRFVYVLCRTSNPGSGEFQDLRVAGEGMTEAGRPLFEHVARGASAWPDVGRVGLVVAGTAPDDLDRIRQVAPELPFLVPGVGAQGGEVERVIRAGPARAGLAGTLPGGALLVNVSRGISGACGDTLDPERTLADAARQWAGRLEVLR